MSSVYDAIGEPALRRLARYHDSADDVPDGLRLPQWSWDSLQTDR